MQKGCYCLGIDIGTSSAKALAVFESGESRVFRVEYAFPADLPASWKDAVVRCLQKSVQEIGQSPAAIAMCAQVGSYLIQIRGEEKPRLLKWAEGGGKRALSHILTCQSQEYYKEQLSMRHPRLESYPLVRLYQLFGQEPELRDRMERVLSPKDYLYEYLTGEYATDPYTWRGLANLEKGKYSSELFAQFRLCESWFSRLYSPWDAAGKLKKEIADCCGIQDKIPVYLGCNDFFAAVLGMGSGVGRAFDVTGTSEHVGVITEKMLDSAPVCGPYFEKNAAYGVTASSGVSIRWAMDQFPERSESVEKMLWKSAKSICAVPIFLPYLQGERAPIWDSSARGVFFGLETYHDHAALYYAVLEGVAFSVRHLWDCLGNAAADQTMLLTGGGASRDGTLNRIKATLLNKPVIPVDQPECGALGAALIAFLGKGVYSSLEEAQKVHCRLGKAVMPDPELQENMEKRYHIYRELYPALETQFAQWHSENQ